MAGIISLFLSQSLSLKVSQGGGVIAAMRVIITVAYDGRHDLSVSVFVFVVFKVSRRGLVIAVMGVIIVVALTGKHDLSVSVSLFCSISVSVSVSVSASMTMNVIFDDEEVMIIAKAVSKRTRQVSVLHSASVSLFH